MAFNLAVMHRDLLEETRRERKYLIRLAYGGVLLVAMVSTLLREDIDRARMTAEMFRGLAFVQFLMLNILSLVLGALAIGLERGGRTLGLLVLSRLSPVEIVLGMWLGRLAAVLSVLACGLPFFAAALSLGGIMLEDVATVFLITAASAALSAAAGIAGAALTRSMNLGLVMAGTILAAVFFIPQTGSMAGIFSPYCAMESALGHGTESHVLESAGICLAAALALLLLAARLVPRAARIDRAPVLAPILEKADGLLEPLFAGTKDGEPPVKRGNPVLNREIMRNSVWRTGHLVKITAAGLAALAVLAALQPGSASLHGAVLVALASAFVFLATFAGTVTISREKETGALFLMVITQLTARQIISGKIMAGMRLSAAGTLVLLGYAAILSIAGLVIPIAAAALAIAVFSSLLFFFVQGLLCALLTRNTTRALATAMAVAAIEVGTFQYGLSFQFANPYQIVKATVPMNKGVGAPADVSGFGRAGVFRDVGSRIIYAAAKSAFVNLMTAALIFILMEQLLEKLMRRHIEQTDVGRESREHFRGAANGRAGRNGKYSEIPAERRQDP
jgi:ABC-type transport system involved in multi-copper enzyme maturation permease subunit